MPIVIHQNLKKRPIMTSDLLQKLDQLSGFAAEDLRLASELTAATNLLVSRLGLDPDDTTSEELRQAILVEYQKLAANFSRQLGEINTTSLASRLSLAVQVINHLYGSQKIWSLKDASVKKILKQHPPKKLMRTLNYRSIDSLLKRENINLLWSVAGTIESAYWLKGRDKFISGLSANDFDYKPFRISLVTDQRWIKVARMMPALLANRETASITLWINKSSNTQNLLDILIITAQEIHEMMTFSAWLRLLVISGRGLSLSKQSTDLVKLPDKSKFISVFSIAPALIIEDQFKDAFDESDRSNYGSLSPIKMLASISPSFLIWAHAEPAIYTDPNGKSASLNLYDVAAFQANSSTAAKSRMEQELVGRYLSHQAVRDYFNSLFADLLLSKNSYPSSGTIKNVGLSSQIGVLV